MCKEGNDQSSLGIFEEKKELEKSCLDDAISKIPWLQKFNLITDDSHERPDFILEKNNMLIGIEHFHIDTLYIDKKRHTGLARYTYNDIRNLYNKYHPKAKQNTFVTQDALDSSLELENIINELISIQNNFDYNFFIKEWSRIFNKHYNKRYEYKQEKHLNKLGFLIEIRRYFKYPYICIKNDSKIRFDYKGIPITKDIAKYLNKYHDGVDFFIVVVKGLFDNYVSVEFYDKKHPAKIEYDSFKFIEIPKKIQINVK